jgi:hypothetical protein
MISVVYSFHQVEMIEEGAPFVPGECLGEAIGRHAGRGDVLN